MRALPEFLGPTRETCPSCGCPCDSPCCPSSPRHAICRRCKRVFVSRVATPHPQAEEDGRP